MPERDIARHNLRAGSTPPPNAGGQPSPWITRFGALARPGGRVLDLACGMGRHSLWFSHEKFEVWAVDLAQAAIDFVASSAPQVRVLTADLEGAPWPAALGHGRFDAVVVANYLWRPLWPQLIASLAPGGVLVVETFAHGQQHIGRPKNPDFLLQPGELLQVCVAHGLHVLAFEDGFEPGPPGIGRFVQRVAAVRMNGMRQTDQTAPPSPIKIAP